MDLEVIKTWLTVINMIGTFGIGVWLYMEKRSDKTNARIDQVETTLGTQGKQLAHLEAKADGAPTHNDLGDLHDRVTAVANAMNSLAGEFAGVKNVLNLIHQHLLNGGKS
jgi:hypothetical protein